jgi:hypothetical protein
VAEEEAEAEEAEGGGGGRWGREEVEVRNWSFRPLTLDLLDLLDRKDHYP